MDPAQTVSTYYLTVDEIMVTYGVTRSYVYKMASERKWRKYRDEERRTHYRCEDVGVTLRGKAAA